LAKLGRGRHEKRVCLLVFIFAIGLLAAPLAAEAQDSKVYRVGLLLQGQPPTSPPPSWASRPGSFRKTLYDLGYIEGRNLILDVRWAEGRAERFPSLIAELVALKPDVIVVPTTPGTIAAMRATATIPIVMVNPSDPVGSGLVTSLARPGGNVTGVTDFGIELSEKAVDLMRTIVPKVTRVAVLMSDNPVHPFQFKAIQDAAKSIGLTVLPTTANSPEELETAFASMAKNNARALIVLGDAAISSERARERLVELAAKTKLPTMFPSRWYVEAGGLLSYSVNFSNLYGLAATYVDKILKGAKPADLPVQQPTAFELVINLQTAKALGLTIPQSLLLRAEQVIE
jgi:putative tryptophan/tyrosine transport system substrate-binding protein